MRGLDLDMSHFEDLDGFGRSPQDCYSWWFPNGWVMLGHFSHHFRGPFTDPSVFPTKGQRQSIGWVCPKMRFCSKHVNMLMYDNICTCHMFFSWEDEDNPVELLVFPIFRPPRRLDFEFPSGIPEVWEVPSAHWCCLPIEIKHGWFKRLPPYERSLDWMVWCVFLMGQLWNIEEPQPTISDI
jgi:hypothetical protein